MFRKAPGTIGTDDHLMRFKNRMHLNRRRKNGNPKKIHIDSTKLKDGKLLEAFPKDLCEIIDDAKNGISTFHKRYELFLSQIKEKAKHHAPVFKNTKSKKKVVVDN